MTEEDAPWPPLPRQNPDLLGQNEAEKALLDAYEGGRMAHAWLLSGPKGIGKATLAYRFGRYLLDQPQADAGPGLFGDELPSTDKSPLYMAPETPVFQRTAGGGHGDLLVVERSLNDKGKLRSEIVVDDVRGIGSFLSMTASEGGWRVVIIDCADEMNRNAANAVLKVLEEPPDRAVLLLVSHNPGRLLPTIRSRCRKLTLKLLPPDVMSGLLETYQPDLGPEDRARLIALSDGSIGRAVDLAAAGGVELYGEVLGVLSTMPGIQIAKLHKLADQLAKSGAEERYRTAMNLLRNILARLLRFRAEGGAGSAVSNEERLLFERIAPGAGLDRWLEVWEKVGGLLERAEAVNLDRKQVVLNVFLEIDGALRLR